MSRNRYRHSHSLQWATVLRWFILIAAIAVFGMTYVLMKNQILRTANEVRDLEKELAQWQKRNQQLVSNINTITAPAALQRRVNELKLRLVRISELETVPMESGTAPVERYQNARNNTGRAP